MQLVLPDDKVKFIKQISGYLEYTVSSGAKEIDLGVTEFKTGMKGKHFNAIIKEIKDSQWHEKGQKLVLNMNIDQDSLASVTFYDSAGKKLETSGRSYMYMGNQATLEYEFEQALPARGRIEVRVYENLNKYKSPFQLKNLSLLGKPLNM